MDKTLFEKQLRQYSLMSCCGFSTQFPEDNGKEIALVGRSNAGKSTIINRILGAKVAHVSQRPGKTQTINFYGKNHEKIVDLPGVGYAKASKQQIRNCYTLQLYAPRLKLRRAQRRRCRPSCPGLSLVTPLCFGEVVHIAALRAGEGECAVRRAEGE